MHSYRFGNFGKPVTADADNGKWFEYLGLQSSGHGPQKPIEITYVDKNHAIAKGLPEWTTINEELYNNISILGAYPLAKGKQAEQTTVVIWTNEYTDKKVRVFSTSLGHNNATVEDARYLDLVARGVLWATGHLNDDGTAAPGYGK
jgi:type 1 glutamine amidotransferase